MPYYKNRNNKSHKSTTSTKSTTSVVNEDDDFGSILKFVKPSSRRSTPKSETPSLESVVTTPIISTPPVPAPPPPSPWELLGMTEEDFMAMQQRVYQRALEYDREIYIQNMLDELNNPSYWQRRIESLEKEREYFNKKRGWSAADMVCVERIDTDIQECEDEIERIYAEVDRLEAEYD